MLDINYIRQNKDKMRGVLHQRKVDNQKADLERLLHLDEQRISLQQEVDKLRAQRNDLSDNLQGKPDQVTINAVKEIKIKLTELENEYKKVETEWQQVMDWMPNVPLDDVPVGESEADNIEIKAWSPDTGYFTPDKLGKNISPTYMPETPVNVKEEFSPKPHWEIGIDLDMIDLEAGSKTTGSRFYYLKNEGVLLMDAIFALMKKKLLEEGFMPMYVPVLVQARTLYGTSHFPGDADQVYVVDAVNTEKQENLYLVGSSEPSLFAYFADKTLNKKDLPTKIMASSSCFRSEAGSWGKDVRGIKRAHQFEKLEMDMIIEANPEQAVEMHEYLLGLNEWLLQALKLPYRVINMCTADLGYYAAAKKYDIEIWLPSQKEYMEAMSDSITTDYQARRLGIKYRDGEELKFAYTLNDTAATHRLLIAIIEHYQQADGSIVVPEILRDYMGKEVIVKK